MTAPARHAEIHQKENLPRSGLLELRDAPKSSETVLRAVACPLGLDDRNRSTAELMTFRIWTPRRTPRARRVEFDDRSRRVVGCAIEFHRALGTGLLESADAECLAHELSRSRIRFEVQHPQPIEYKALKLELGYRLDLLVERELIPELKSVGKLTGVNGAPSLT